MDATKVSTEKEHEIFPTRLRELIQEKKISQKDLAEKIGITRQSVSLYANGQRNPDIEVFKRICQYFDISSDYLLGLSDIKKFDIENSVINKKLKFDEETIQIIENLSHRYDLLMLSDEQRKIEEQNRNTFLHINIFNEFVKTSNYSYEHGFFQLMDTIWGYAYLEEFTNHAQKWVLQNVGIEYDEKNHIFTEYNLKKDSEIILKYRTLTNKIIDKQFIGTTDTKYILLAAAEEFKEICKMISANLIIKIAHSNIFKRDFEKFKELYSEQEKTS